MEACFSNESKFLRLSCSRAGLVYLLEKIAAALELRNYLVALAHSTEKLKELDASYDTCGRGPLMVVLCAPAVPAPILTRPQRKVSHRTKHWRADSAELRSCRGSSQGSYEFLRVDDL